MLNVKKTLTKILNGIPNTEHRELLWTNPSPTTGFAEQDILSTTDFTKYDEIEVIGVNYKTYGSIMPVLRVPIGEYGNLIGIAGSNGDSTGTGFLVARRIRSHTDKIHVSEAVGVATNGTNWGVLNDNMIPLRVYGIKLGGVIRQLLSTLTTSERGWCCA